MKILSYFISLLLLSLVSETKGQETRTYGLRVGYDLSRIPLNFMNPKRTGFEFSGDFEALKNLYPVFEAGMGKMNLDKSNFQYSSDGRYLRFGIDYNMLKPQIQNQYDMVFFGIRYCVGTLHYSVNGILINDAYWGDFAGSLPDKTMHSNWIEIAGGVRTELFHNLFIGWSLRGRFMLFKTRDINIDPYNIPGFGAGSKKSAFGINYCIYYKIPVFKRKITGTTPE